MPPDPVSVFTDALALPPADRAAFLDAACGADPAARAAVADLLAAHDRAGRFLGGPRPAPTATGAAEAGGAATRAWADPAGNPAGGLAGAVLAGRYVLVEPVGEGGMGAVWRADQTAPVRRPVAVKLVKPGMDTRQVLARFEAERQALAVMDHPNIARVLDAGSTPDGRPFFVMELVPGVPITRYCDDRRLTVRDRLGLFLPVCEAVQHAHRKGVIHRDVKPSNVLVAEYDGAAVPKVIDFGIAKAAAPGPADVAFQTAAGAVVGTPAYMAPEQAVLGAGDVDTRADVYGLGALLYELLAGSPPFTRNELRKAGLLEVLRVVREQEPPRPSDRLSTADTLPGLAAARGADPRRLAGLVRADLDWVVMKALEKDRERRYGAADDLAADVRRYLAGEPVRAHPPGRLYRARKFVRRHRGAVAVAAALALALAVGAAGTGVGFVRATRKEADARRLAGALQRVLGSVTPDTEQGLDYTVLRMLDDHEAGLSDELAGLPGVEADLRTTVGRVYLNLDAAGKAAGQFERALALRRGALPADDPRVAESLTDLARALLEEGRPGEPGTADRAARAEGLAREAVAALRRPGLGEGPELAQALVTLGLAVAHREIGDEYGGTRRRTAAAAAAAGEADAIMRRRGEARPSPVAADAALAVARYTLAAPGDAGGLVAAYERAIALCEAAHGPRHPTTATGWLSLSRLHGTYANYPEVERCGRRALEAYTRAYGRDRYHAQTAEALIQVAFGLEGQFREREADALVAGYEARWRAPVYAARGGAYGLRLRAEACLGRGDPGEAAAHLRRVAGIARAAGGGPDRETRGSLAAALFLAGRAAEAREVWGPEVAKDRADGLSRDPADRDGTDLLARAERLLAGGDGRADLLAARQLTDAVRDLPLPRQYWRAGHPQAVRAWVYHRLRKADREFEPDPAADYARLAEAADRFAPALHSRALPWHRLLERDLAEAADATGDAAKGEQVRRGRVERAKTYLPAAHPEVAAARVVLADFLLDRGRPADAEVELVAARRLLADHPQAAVSSSLVRRRADVLERLVRVCTALNRRADAARYQAEWEALPAEPAPPPKPADP